MNFIFRFLLTLLSITALNAKSHISLGSNKQELTVDEKELIAYEFSKDPNATMFSVFVKEFTKDFNEWESDPKRLLKLPLHVLMWVRQVLIEMVKDLKYAGGWMISAIIKPLQAIRDIKYFFIELIEGFWVLAKMIWKDWRKGLLNFFGGLLFLVSHHSAEFTAQTILVLAVGFKVISPLGDLVKASVEASGASGMTAVVVKRVCVTFFWVLHGIDDPLIILSSILPALTAGGQKIKDLKDPKISKKFVQQDILGLDPSTTSSNISKQEFKSAYTSFISFICTNTTQTLQYNDETIDFSDECS